MKCSYSYCTHCNDDVQPETKYGTKPFHTECLVRKNIIDEIKSICVDKIREQSGNCNIGFATKVINDLVFKKQTDEKQLLFFVANSERVGFKLFGPTSLYMLMKNEALSKAYVKYISENSEGITEKFNYTTAPKKRRKDLLSFSDILI